MKPKEIFNSKIPTWLGVGGITIYPWIFYEGTPELPTRVHEFTHCYQVQTQGWIKFYVSYLWSYLKGRLSGLDHYDSYMAIPYEVEAYDNEDLFREWLNKNPWAQEAIAPFPAENLAAIAFTYSKNRAGKLWPK